MTKAPTARLVWLAAGLLACAAVALFVGAVDLSPRRVLGVLLAPHAADPAVPLVLRIRLPRVVLGALVGAALSISGTLLQAFFQNPMAGPYVVGVSAGAGLAAVAAITLGFSFRWGPLDTVTLASFVGGLASVALVYALARRIRFLQAEGLLLIGIAIGAICSALTSLLLLFGQDGTQTALFWMMGSFSAARWSTAGVVGLVTLLAGVPSLLLSRDLNLLLWGEEVAVSLGSPVRRVRAWVLALSSLLAAAAVASCGVIGFVGLMVPHLARGFLGTSDHRFVLPGSALIGAVLVVVADGFARALVAPVELPVGAITSAFGAPFLVWLVVRRHRRLAGS
jgi:iron complex transport system permease protein